MGPHAARELLRKRACSVLAPGVDEEKKSTSTDTASTTTDGPLCRTFADSHRNSTKSQTRCHPRSNDLQHRRPLSHRPCPRQRFRRHSPLAHHGPAPSAREHGVPTGRSRPRQGSIMWDYGRAAGRSGDGFNNILLTVLYAISLLVQASRTN